MKIMLSYKVFKGDKVMLNLFKKKEDTQVFHQPYRPSWEKSAKAWQEGHIARKKACESLKHELSSNTLPRV